MIDERDPAARKAQNLILREMLDRMGEPIDHVMTWAPRWLRALTCRALGHKSQIIAVFGGRTLHCRRCDYQVPPVLPVSIGPMVKFRRPKQ
jgi:hypothetical protein